MQDSQSKTSCYPPPKDPFPAVQLLEKNAKKKHMIQNMIRIKLWFKSEILPKEIVSSTFIVSEILQLGHKDFKKDQ